MADWLKALSPIATIMLLALLFGAAIGYASELLVISLLACLAYYIKQLVRLKVWLAAPTSLTPVGYALWGEVYDDLHRVQALGQANTRRLGGLVKQFSKSAKAMPDGVVVLDAQLSIVWANPAAAKLLGLKRKADLGQRINNLVRHPDFVAYLQQRAFATPLEFQVSTPKEAVLSVRIIPYGGQQLLMLVQDISEIRHIDRMRHDFVANASHELRTPLTVIKGYLDALDNGQLPDAWQPAFGSMREQAERMQQIIHDLLELLRLESSGNSSMTEPQPIAQMVQAVCDEAATLSQGRLTIETELDSELLLLGSDTELHSIISNLVMNAVYYSPQQGTVTVRWLREGQGAALTVRDTGVGIAREHTHRITERFYRINNPQVIHEGGSGLGLAIVKHALQRHDASLEVSSKPGYGSLFHCRFPASRVVVREPLPA